MSPAPAALDRPSRRQQGAVGGGMIPFTAAAHEHTEPGGFDFTQILTTSQQSFGPFDIPSFGFLRHLVIQVTTATAGTIGAGVVNEDYPFNIINSISLNDVNGAPIIFPLTGYELFWANVAGGYAFQQDARNDPAYSANNQSPAFTIRIPIEIHHNDGLGCLPNQNAAASYKVNLTLNNIAGVYSTAPTTPPTVRVRAWLEAWTLPNPTDNRGRAQEQFPPANGTTQYWSKFTKTINASNNSVLLPRVGNLIRSLLVITRNNAGVRDNSAWINPVRLTWDQRDLYNEDQAISRTHTKERLVQLTALDTGVFIYSFNHSHLGRSGDGNANLWLPTTQATRLEFQGVAASAGTATILTNDVAPAEISPQSRYVEGSMTGGSPGGGAGRV